MPDPTVLEDLIHHDIVHATEDEFSVAEDFLTRLEAMDTTAATDYLETSRLATELSHVNWDHHVTNATLPTDFPPLLATVTQAFDDLGFQAILKRCLLIDHLRKSDPVDGTPAHFVPIRGTLLPFLTDCHPSAVVYIWKHDCEPCDVMVQELETVFPESPESIPLFSVFGPDYAPLLNDEYDVVGGPTLLFFEYGDVAVRLQGAHYADVIEAEVTNLPR